ncbi:MAG TPA: peptidase, partial [Alphaproteobacteria bacterium]|nr:peptidase [Alphaproteobacteria bacterium]
VEALERVDAFLEGLLDAMEDDVLLLVASDHGNVEDVTAGHTRNPALGAALGLGAGAAAELRDIRQVAGFVLGILGAEASATEG